MTRRRRAPRWWRCGECSHRTLETFDQCRCCGAARPDDPDLLDSEEAYGELMDQVPGRT